MAGSSKFYVDLLELTEDVCILRLDTTSLQHSDTESKDAPNFQLTCQTITAQFGVCNVAQFEVYEVTEGVLGGTVVWYIESDLWLFFL